MSDMYLWGLIEDLRAGEDSTPVPEYAYPTASQLWYRLIEADKHERLALLNRLIEDSQQASVCSIRDCEKR